MKARAAGLLAFALLAAVGLTACSRSHAIKPLSLKNAPRAFRDLNHPHKYTPAEVKAAFANQGITLREMRNPYGAHGIVLWDSKWPAPTRSQLEGGTSYIWVFVHASDADIASGGAGVGNVYVMNGSDEESRVNAAFDTLYRSSHH